MKTITINMTERQAAALEPLLDEAAHDLRVYTHPYRRKLKAVLKALRLAIGNVKDVSED